MKDIYLEEWVSLGTVVYQESGYTQIYIYTLILIIHFYLSLSSI